MTIKIITQPFQFIVHGFGAIATNKDYTGIAFKLSGKMWDIIKANNIKNKGKNIWVYETAEGVFAGVELENPNGNNHFRLEEKKIKLEKYAYYKHIGPYNLIKQAGQNMIDELNKQGFEISSPYIEIYGHWTADETKSETELLMCLK